MAAPEVVIVGPATSAAPKLHLDNQPSWLSFSTPIPSFFQPRSHRRVASLRNPRILYGCTRTATLKMKAMSLKRLIRTKSLVRRFKPSIFGCHSHKAIDLIRSIYDPEHPNTLEELRVVSASQITVRHNHVKVEFTPTVPHCGMSTLIGGVIFLSNIAKTYLSCEQGLSIRVRLLRSLPSRYKVDILVKPGSHQSENSGGYCIDPCCTTAYVYSVNKQLNDKERVAAALENPPLVDTVEKCLAKTCGHSH